MFTLPKLPYAYDALEPHIDAKTMEIHHTKHHQGYVDNLNKQIEKYPELGDWSLEELMINLDKVPADVKIAVKNNGGGHWNHSFFWEMMSPKGGGEPKNEFKKAIEESFGSLDDFKSAFKKAGLSRFGSGWVWLGIDHDGTLHVASTPNQNNPLMQGIDAILGVDVWEHAYYLKYQNKRGDYLDAFWSVVNWEKAEENYKTIAL
jgi:superoxide dismutase, Fe-Mn family